MSKKVEKLLRFNGKSIVMLSKNGIWWVAIKPICEALGVNYERQRQNLFKSRNPALLPAPQQVVAADGKLREMICLPEFATYGWIFKIESDAAGLENYQWECYQLLYEHFHGAIAGRKQLLGEKAKAQIEVERCINSMKPEMALKLAQANRQIKWINSELRKMDYDLIEEEKTLFDGMENKDKEIIDV